MARPTAETLLISAAMNSRDPSFWKRWGITSRHFHGYRDHAEWLEEFGKDYQRTPTWTEFQTKFDDFPVNTDQEDGLWPATEVIEQYNTRTATRMMLKATNTIKSGKVDEGIDLIRQLEVHRVASQPTNVLTDTSLLDDYSRPQDRIKMPWESLQKRTLGIGQGELWYIGARPSQGKSIHTSYIAANAALQGYNVIIYALEMTKTAMAMRLQVMLGNVLGFPVTHDELRRRRIDPRDYKRLIALIDEKVPGKIHVHTPADGPCRPSVVSARATEYDLSIVDHMGLMRPEGHGRSVDDWRVAAALSNEMKEIALARNTRILSASQINREGDGSFKPPKLSQLSQSDALGQDADVVLTLTKYKRAPGASHFSIEKNRDGEAQVQFWTKFDVNAGGLEEISREEADDIADEYED